MRANSYIVLATAILAAATWAAAPVHADSGASTTGDWIHVAPTPSQQSQKPRVNLGLVQSQRADAPADPQARVNFDHGDHRVTPLAPPAPPAADNAQAPADDQPATDPNALPPNRAPHMTVINQGVVGPGTAQPTAVLAGDQTSPDAPAVSADHMGAAVSNSAGITRAGMGAGNSPSAGAGNTGVGTDQSGATVQQRDDPTTVSNSDGITRSGIGLGDTPLARRATWDAGGDVVHTANGGAGEGSTVSSSGGLSRAGTGYGQVYSGGGDNYAGDPNAGNVVSNSSGLTRAGDGTRGDPTVTRTFGMTPGLLGNRGR